LRKSEDNLSESWLRVFRNPVFYVFLSVLVVSCSTVFGQEDISGVMERGVRTVGSFLEAPGRSHEGDIKAELSDIDSVLIHSGRLSGYQVWTLKYIQAYLHYIRGIAGGNRADFRKAGDLFEEVAENGDEGFNPAKKDFADYMRAWCGIRAYQSGGEIKDIDYTLEILEGMASPELEYDLKFLRGYANLVRAGEAVRDLSVTERAYRSALVAQDIFSDLRFRDDIGEAAYYYHTYSRWLKFRFARIYHLSKNEEWLPASSTSEGVPALEDVTGNKMEEELSSLREYAVDVARRLEGSSVEGQLRYMVALSLLQSAAGELSCWIEENRDSFICLNQENLAARYNLYDMDLSGMDKPGQDIINMSRSLIMNRTVSVDGEISREAAFWKDAGRMFSYIQNDKDRFFGGTRLLRNLPPGLFKTEWSLERGSAADSVLAAKQHLYRAYCELLSAENPHRMPRLRNGKGLKLLSAVIPLARKASRSGRRFVSERNIQFMLSRIDPHFSLYDYLEAGRTAMTMANCIPRLSTSQERKRRVLYTSACMLFSGAEESSLGSEIDLKAEIALQKSFSLINSAPLGDTDGNGNPDNHDALNKVLDGILAENVISRWAGPYRNEARYYRSVMERQVRGRFLDRTREELSMISSVDPRAAYIMGYEAVKGSDRKMLEQCACLTERTECSGWLRSLLKTVCTELDFSRQECSGPEIAPRRVRYDILRAGESECNLTRSFILGELYSSLKIWSACVKPPTLLFPWSAEMKKENALGGPAEFAYLQDDVRVNIQVRGPEIEDARLTVMSDLNTVVYQGEVSGLPGLRSGRRYILVFTGKGWWPRVLERTFRVSGETVTADMKQAYMNCRSGQRPKKDGDGRAVYFSGDQIVTIGPAGVRYYLNGEEKIGRPQPGHPLRNVNEFVFCGGEIFAYDNNNGEVLNLSEGQEKDKILDLKGYGVDPSDIASDGELLYITDQKRGIINIYDPRQRVFSARVATGINPALVTVMRVSGRIAVAAYDPDRGLMVTERGMSDFVPAGGLEAAVNDGMSVPSRLAALPEHGLILCRNNLFDRKLFMFLPTGGYAGSVAIPDEVSPPYYFVEYSGPDLRIGTSGGIVNCRLEVDGNYNYKITGPVAKPKDIDIRAGGWFTSR